MYICSKCCKKLLDYSADPFHVLVVFSSLLDKSQSPEDCVRPRGWPGSSADEHCYTERHCLQVLWSESQLSQVVVLCKGHMTWNLRY